VIDSGKLPTRIYSALIDIFFTVDLTVALIRSCTLIASTFRARWYTDQRYWLMQSSVRTHSSEASSGHGVARCHVINGSTILCLALHCGWALGPHHGAGTSLSRRSLPRHHAGAEVGSTHLVDVVLTAARLFPAGSTPNNQQGGGISDTSQDR
jgi:hypothetical protein